MSHFSRLPANILASCLDFLPDEEAIWQQTRQLSALKLVSKQWKAILEEAQEGFAVLDHLSQATRLLSRCQNEPHRAARLRKLAVRFPKAKPDEFVSQVASILEIATSITHLALLLFDDTVESQQPFDRLLAGIEGLRSLQHLALLPVSYRSDAPIKQLPLRSFLAFCTQPELRRLDIFYLPGAKELPKDLESPSPKLRCIHTASSSFGRTTPDSGSSHSDASAVERWLFTPEQLEGYISFGVVDMDPFLKLSRERPGVFRELRSLRLDFADLPRLTETGCELPNLKQLHLDGFQPDHDFKPLTHYSLELVEFWHECDPDTDRNNTERGLSLKEIFKVDVLDSLRSLPDKPFPFRHFVLRCDTSCGPLDRLEDAAELCRAHDATFARNRGTDLGWVVV